MAVAGVASTGADKAIPALDLLRSNASNDVRQAAAAALKKIQGEER